MTSTYAVAIQTTDRLAPIQCCALIETTVTGACVCTGCGKLLAVLPVIGTWRCARQIHESEEGRPHA